ncbi:Cytochrome P479 monooxygenase [Paramyrothecium foliicola]|nr:Cytochrome P479 monooxygenase [Paramyrothecium foliicola]
MNETWPQSTLILNEPSSVTSAKYTCYVAVLLILIACLGIISHGYRKSRLNIPGPQGLPVIGNILDLRKGHAETLGQWTKKYHDIFRIVLGNREVIVLNTRAAVAKTLVKQGASFQSRPETNLWHELFIWSADTGGALTLGTAKWTPDVSKLRKLLAPHTTAQRLPRFNHFVSRRYFRLIKLLASTVAKPQDLGYYWWTTAVGLGTDQLVGKIHDDDFVKLIAETEIGIFRLRALGYPISDWIFLVQMFELVISTVTSVLRRLFKALAFPVPALLLNDAEEICNELRLNQAKYSRRQLAELAERISNGDRTPSQLGDLFRALPDQLPALEQYTLITTLSGSGMATGSTLSWLMGYLAAHSDLQERAYEAINEVYHGQVPDPHDTDRVEYLKALGLEASRYWVPIRLGFPRETNVDSQIDNCFVPKGTMVVYNSFQINRDPIGYDAPNDFIPERWMNGHQGRTDISGVAGDKIGVPHMAHGAGRRICYGVANVNKSLYGILALTLHFFKLERVELDNEGMQGVFPSFRACRQASVNMDPVHDQVSTVDAQGLPCAAGIRLIPRNPDQLAFWISEGHQALQDFEAPSSWKSL